MFSLLIYIDIFLFMRLCIYMYLFISQENFSFVEKPEEPQWKPETKYVIKSS